MSKCVCGSDKDGSTLSRRQFLKETSAGAVALGAMGAGLPVMAGPFTVDDFDRLVPADKKLSEAWTRSLFERGAPDWYGGEDLKYIGMPVGGICCGHVYLGGDGRLWHWDIFNQVMRTDYRGPNYAEPMAVDTGIELGFTVRADTEGKDLVRPLDATGFSNVRFRGAYPIGFVEYDDDSFPLKVSLEAFSPFSPLEVDDSSLPLTVMRFTVRNTFKDTVEVTLAGQMANPVLKHSGNGGVAEFVNAVQERLEATCIHYTVDKLEPEDEEERPDIVFDDFEADHYENWTVDGTAFGPGPIIAAEMPGYQGDAHGERLVNSWNFRQGIEGDAQAHVGVMTSRPFTIERRYINVRIGGGADTAQTSLQLLIGDAVVAKLAGQNQENMRPRSFHVRDYQGQVARLRIVDESTGDWGNIGLDYILFSDRPAVPKVPLEERRDMGDMTLALLDHGGGFFATAGLPEDSKERLFAENTEAIHSSSHFRPIGAVGKSFSLAPGEETTLSFAVGWRFPNHPAPVGKGHYYAERFASSLKAVDYLAGRYDEFYKRTRLWHDTWYDSTLPYWLLDRTFINTSTLATGTCLRMEGGRFYGWEGVGCCESEKRYGVSDGHNNIIA